MANQTKIISVAAIIFSVIVLIISIYFGILTHNYAKATTHFSTARIYYSKARYTTDAAERQLYFKSGQNYELRGYTAKKFADSINIIEIIKNIRKTNKENNSG